MKIGVVGLGFMGSTHLQAYRKIPNAELTAVASNDEKKLSGDLGSTSGNLGRETEPLDFTNVARYRSAEELFADANVDAVDLCVPSHLHASFTQAALQARKHVLVEKPMALSGEECDAMITAARQNERVLMVAQVLRFWPDYVAAREIVRSGMLGSVKAAFFRRKCAAPAWSPWMRDRAKSGGGVFDLLIHDVDYCLHLFGKPKAITAVGTEDLNNGLDLVDARLEYDSGMPVSISGGWHLSSEHPFSMEFSIALEGGVLDFHSAQRRLTLYRANGKTEEPVLPKRDGFESELETFVRACEIGTPPEECPPEESALATRMGLAMRDSRERKGQPVSI